MSRSTKRVFTVILVSTIAAAWQASVWTLFNLFLLGPWVGAWSFNVLYCWMAGGIVGILPVAFLARAKQLPQ